MKTFSSLLVLVALSVMAFGEPAPPREEWHRGLSFEDTLRSAELIVVVRVEDVKQTMLVRASKAESATYQFRFKPLRVIKGVFARPELMLGSDDLGDNVRAQLKFMKAGQTRLMFLSRSDVGYQNCNQGGGSIDHTFPPITGADDPLLQSVNALLKVAAETNRIQRVKLLSAALEKSSGASAEPLLAAMNSFALLAAQIPEAPAAVMRHLADPSTAVRIAAANTLKLILKADYLEQPALRDKAAAALAAALAAEGPNIEARANFIRACGSLGTIHDPALVTRLDFMQPAHSIQEGIAQVQAVGSLRLAAFADKLFTLSQNMPLDANYDYSVEEALARVDPVRGSAEIMRHAEAAIAAGSDCIGEIDAAGSLPPFDAVALLVRMAELPLDARERETFARIALEICRKNPDERLVAPLAKLLDPDEPQTRTNAVGALIAIGSLSAAQALQPHLGEETSIEGKLRIAELLGRHGMQDGYAYAIEHANEYSLTDEAVAALAAMRDPRTLEETQKILETSNDERWNAAAIRILGAIGAKEFAPKFLAFASDWKNPLAPPSLIALGDLGEAQVLPRIRDALNARNGAVAEAAARAAARLLKNPEIQGNEIRDQLAALLMSEDASPAAREAALETLLALKDSRLDKALVVAVSDSTISTGLLDHSYLLAPIEDAMRVRKVKLP